MREPTAQELAAMVSALARGRTVAEATSSIEVGTPTVRRWALVNPPLAEALRLSVKDYAERIVQRYRD